MIGSPVMAQMDCDDGDACTNDWVDATFGQCTYTPVTCDDSDMCTFDVCDSKAGCGHYPVMCSDGDPLTTDSCDQATGCVYASADCDDADACTVDQVDPDAGQCVHRPVDCDDGDRCTDDTCDKAAGCEYAPVDCEDGDPTTIDACDPADGMCVHIPMDSLDPLVSIDIKPGSCLNPLNVRSRGVVPVVLFGSEGFDVTTIDPESIRMTREGFEGVPPVRYAYMDAGAPSVNREPCACDDAGREGVDEPDYLGDGFMDLALKFSVPDVADGLGLKDVAAGETVLLTIVGETMADATPVAGEDCVRIINKLKWREQPTRPRGPTWPKAGR
jgi:hypothetical protein